MSFPNDGLIKFLYLLQNNLPVRIAPGKLIRQKVFISRVLF